ncbi:MAG: secretion protein F [Oscillospiraceae bacterium]|nr:secretion protein F [Oscillospiraceae bacterium]
MLALLFLFGGLLAAGFFFIAADRLRIPTLAATNAMRGSGKKSKKLEQVLEAWLMSTAVKISRFIRMDEYKRSRMKNILKAAGIRLTPEEYMGYAYVKTGATLSGVLMCLMIVPLLSPVFVFLAIAVYFKETRKADEQLKAIRERIERDLPRFVMTIEQELKTTRDVLGILENYKKNAGEALRHELDIVCADMRSSSYEVALTRFEARFNSPQLSDVVRGLIGVLRGDDGGVYFQMLAHDFKLYELQKLKKEAQKIPPKVRKYSFFMLMCFLFTYLAIIAVEIMSSLGNLF